MNESEKGFIISLTEYREHDAMIHFLGENHGLMRLVLPGYYRSKSKQHALGLQWSYVDYQFKYKENSLNTIISGELLEAYLLYRQDFEWLSFMTFVSEILVRACVICKSQKIDSFSIEHGGFLCQEHSIKKNDKLALVLIYQIFHDLELSSSDTESQYELLNTLVSYFEYHGDYRFNSWQFIYNNGR